MRSLTRRAVTPLAFVAGCGTFVPAITGIRVSRRDHPSLPTVISETPHSAADARNGVPAPLFVIFRLLGAGEPESAAQREPAADARDDGSLRPFDREPAPEPL